MSRVTKASGLIMVGFAVLLASAAARANTIDKLTYMTFSGPVQIPGVTLKAGTYRFHVTNPTTNPYVLQVLSRDGMTVYSQFLTIPAYRATPTADATVTLRETRADTPPAIRSFFEGGKREGYEFIYPSAMPSVSEPSPSAAVTPAAVKPAAEQAVRPAPVQQQAEANASPTVAPVQPASKQAAPAAAPQSATPSTSAKPELPRTASTLPAIGLTGLGMVLFGWGISTWRRRLS
jgi:hypothetical protein